VPAGDRPGSPTPQAGGWPPRSIAGGPPAAGGTAGLGIPEPPQPPPLPAPGGQPAPGRPRSALRTALLALIAVAVIAGGGYYALTHRTGTSVPTPSASARPTPTATPTPTPPPTPTPSATTTVTFTDPGHHFSAAFPATPQSATESETLDGTTLTYTGWTAVDPSTGDEYVVVDMPYPASVNVSDPELSLQAGVNSMVSSLKATVISQTSGTADGYPDVDVLISYSSIYIDYQCVLAGHAFYGAGVESAQDPPPGFAAFAASLTIYSTAAATG
jgi:hypothetical protein